MRIHQILNGVDIILTKQEKEFIDSHHDVIRVGSLDENSTWTAQNLVRKGVYQTTNDGNKIILNRGHSE